MLGFVFNKCITSESWILLPYHQARPMNWVGIHVLNSEMTTQKKPSGCLESEGDFGTILCHVKSPLKTAPFGRVFPKNPNPFQSNRIEGSQSHPQGVGFEVRCNPLGRIPGFLGSILGCPRKLLSG